MKNANMISKYLLARHKEPKERLEFPIGTQQKKHFEGQKADKVRLGSDQTDFFLKSAKRNNNLNVDDIEGAKPTNNHRARSEKNLKSLPSEHGNIEIRDQLDSLTKSGLHKRDLSMKHLHQGNESKCVER